MPAGQPSFGEALVDHRENRDFRLRLLVEDAVEQPVERLCLLRREEPQRTRRLEALEDDVPRDRIPVIGLREHVEAGEPRLPPARCRAGPAGHRSRRRIAARTPIAPTAAKLTGAKIGGPITTL